MSFAGSTGTRLFEQGSNFQIHGYTDEIGRQYSYAYDVNQSTQNIGARRLYTILERLLEEVSFEAPDMKQGRITVNAAYVSERLRQVAEDEDLSKYIL